MKQPTSAVARLSGGCAVVDCHYVVPVVDGDDKVQVVKAMAWTALRPWAPQTCLLM